MLGKEDDVDINSFFTTMASELHPALKDPLDLSPAWQWKVALNKGAKDKFELYEELAKAPGEAVYVPGKTQWAAHRDTSKVKQFVGGWRLGKSKWLAAEILPILFKDNAHVWNVANTYELGRPEFEYVVQWLMWLGMTPDHGLKLSMPQTGQWQLRTPWNARLATMTAEDVTKLEAANLDAVGIAEAGQIPFDVVTRLSGRVLQKDGPMLLSGSFESSLPWYLDYFERHQNGSGDNSWHSFSAPSWENLIVFPGGEDDPKIKQQRNMWPQDVFDLKIAAKPIKPRELVFAEFDKRIHVVPIVPAKVSPYTGEKLWMPEPEFNDEMEIIKWYVPSDQDWEVAIDPGYTGAYAVEFIQTWNGNVFIADEVYARYTVVEDVISEYKQKDLWTRVDGGVIDVAGTQHQGMKSHQESWAAPHSKGGANIHMRSQKWPIEENIKRVRTFLQNPMTKRPNIFVDPKCQGIIDEFRLHRYPPPRDNVPEREKPIDKDNHGLKALGYWLLDKFGRVGEQGGVVSMSYIGTDRRYKTQEKIDVRSLRPGQWNPLD